ncbi:hypothetical protein ACFLQ8_00660 [Candidatus Auribacterota bacterium]
MLNKRSIISLLVLFFTFSPINEHAIAGSKQVPPGSYDAYIWNHGVYWPGFPNHIDGTHHLPVPVVLTFDEDGNFFGTVNYELPRTYMRSLANNTGPAHWKTSKERILSLITSGQRLRSR